MQHFNKFVHYINAETKEIVFTDYFFDPGLQWIRQKDGNYILASMYGGQQTPEWLKNNPKPMR